jgi:hypothetical protein
MKSPAVLTIPAPYWSICKSSFSDFGVAFSHSLFKLAVDLFNRSERIGSTNVCDSGYGSTQVAFVSYLFLVSGDVLP